MNRQELEKTVDALRQAIRLHPADFNAHIRLGNALRAQGKPGEAEEVYRQAIRLQPDCAEVYSNLCMVLREQGRFDEALDAVRRTIRMKPSFPDAHSNMGNVFREQGKLIDAAAAYREAIRLKPTFVEAMGNLAVVLTDLGNLEEAAAICRQAIAIRPGYAGAHVNLGNALRSLGRYAEARVAFQQALLLDPDLAESHVNHAMTLLVQGDFQWGFQEFEWRWRKKDSLLAHRHFVEPQWAGEPLNGKSILLHAEQGFGDTIQFVRFIPMVAGRGGKVILGCPPQLHRLFAGLPGLSQIIGAGEQFPAFDVQCPLVSLPLALGTRLDSIPQATPYLHADPRLFEKWKALLPIIANGLKVGLAWAGSSANRNDKNRSIEVDLLAPLVGLEDVTFISLQVGKPAPAGLDILDFQDRLTDFAETAALIANLDLVITVDTSVAHLAGAMGKPTFVMIPFAPDWRWLLDRDDSPWYPTIRLFRQKSIGDWKSVIEKVAASLSELTKSAQ